VVVTNSADIPADMALYYPDHAHFAAEGSRALDTLHGALGMVLVVVGKLNKMTTLERMGFLLVEQFRAVQIVDVRSAGMDYTRVVVQYSHMVVVVRYSHTVAAEYSRRIEGEKHSAVAEVQAFECYVWKYHVSPEHQERHREGDPPAAEAGLD
jgi:hypothetical protein